jgi:hypothetical protein
MDKKASRPQTTKSQVIREGVKRLEIAHRRDFAAHLLLGPAGLPAHWLAERQRVFVELENDGSMVDPALLRDARALVDQVVRFCFLVYQLIDEFLWCDKTTQGLDQEERANLCRGGGPAAVCQVLFRRCDAWPAAAVSKPVRSEVRTALRQVLLLPHAGAPAPVAVTPGRPLDDRHLAVWHKSLATMDDASLRRHLAYDSAEDRHILVRVAAGVAVAVSFAVAYLAVFLALQHLAPALNPREDMVVAAAAVTTTVGPTGVVLAGALFSARRGRRRARTGQAGDAE